MSFVETNLVSFAPGAGGTRSFLSALVKVAGCRGYERKDSGFFLEAISEAIPLWRPW